MRTEKTARIRTPAALVLAAALLLCPLAACGAPEGAPVTTAAASMTAVTTTSAAITTAAVTSTSATTTKATTAAEPKALQLLGTMKAAQDGAIWGDWLFRFAASGFGYAYRVQDALADGWKAVKPVCTFLLDRSEEIVPHSNSVCFGSKYYAPGDEFPLLYSNIYNNYEDEKDRRLGTCCVYRLIRDGDSFSAELVQIIRIGFLSEGDLWNGGGVIYGNFAVDREADRLIAFVMRGNDRTTRYFSFDLPEPDAGEPHPTLNVPCVTLQSSDILSRFDGPYSNFIQGAAVHDGRLYSVEGRGMNYKEAGLRVVDLAAEKELFFADFVSLGFPTEPEMIDFAGDSALYSDVSGMLYRLDLAMLETAAQP